MDEAAVAEQGVIAKMRRNFGFISCPRRVADVFFHQTSLEDCCMEQLTEGTAVTFVVDRVDGGKLIAKRVRLAPVGSRVRLQELEPGTILGQVSDPANGGSKGIVRFISSDGAPEHLLYDAADVQSHHRHPQPQRVSSQHNLPDNSQHHHHIQIHQRQPQGLVKGQLVFFRIATDTRAAQLARQTAAALAAAGGGGGGPPPRRIAYQRAVGLRPLTTEELATQPPQTRRHAELLELLDAAVQASRAAKAEGGAPQQQPR